MTHPVEIRFIEADSDKIASHEGRIAVLVTPGTMPRLPGFSRPARDAIRRAMDAPEVQKLKPGQSTEIAWPAGMQAEAI